MFVMDKRLILCYFSFERLEFLIFGSGHSVKMFQKSLCSSAIGFETQLPFKKLSLTLR